MDAPFNLSNFHYAHRGLWSKDGPPENSIPAFEAAITAGYGMEFDVRPSADGVPVLFHDDVLDRMTGSTGPVWKETSHSLANIELKGSEATVPTLAELLKLWPKHLPLLTELKVDGQTNGPALSRCVASMLKSHGGLHTIMSFDEETVSAIPKGTYAGQLHYPISETSEAAFYARLKGAVVGRADYICVWHEDAARAAEKTRAAGMPLCVYTVRTRAEHKQLRVNAGEDVAVIFERYDPRLA